MTRVAAVALLVLGVRPGVAADEPQPKDPLAAEIARWSSFVRETESPDENWKDLKQGMEPAMVRVESALRDGRRLLALERLATVRPNLAGFAYVNGLPPDKRDAAGLEAEYARLGPVVSAKAAPLEGVRPAAVRAEAETVLPQARNYYETSLEYGRATMPWSGFFYLGVAQAQRDFVAFCRTLSEKTDLAAPRLRPLDGELDALEVDLLGAYRPPASIDRHSEFIGASAALKEARELNAAGLRHGALLRYLQAAMRIESLQPDAAAADAESLPKRLEGFDSRLRGSVDHSIGRLYLETAQANPAFAEVIARDVLPRYFAALEPAPAAVKKAAPSLDVTLVRWPYT